MAKKVNKIWMYMAFLFMILFASLAFITMAYAPPSYFLDWYKTVPQSIYTWLILLFTFIFAILGFVFAYKNYNRR